MQPGIFAKTFAETGAVPVLAAVRAAGFHVAQFNMACVGLPSLPDIIPAEIVADIAAASQKTGVALAAVSATYNMIDPDLTLRAAGRRRLEEIIRHARAMGAPLVTLCTGTRDREDQWRHHPGNGSPEAWRDLLEEMSVAVRLAETYGVDLGVEPELANVVNSAQAAHRLIGELQSPRLRIVLDPANLFEIAAPDVRREMIARAVGLLGDRIAMAHAKDRDAAGKFVAAGQGVIDFVHFVRCLREAGFDGPLITHGLAAHEAGQVAEFLNKVIAA